VFCPWLFLYEIPLQIALDYICCSFVENIINSTKEQYSIANMDKKIRVAKGAAVIEYPMT